MPTSTRQATGKEGGDQALGRSRGGFSTKLPVRAERGGKPVAVVVTAGHRHEQRVTAGAAGRGGGQAAGARAVEAAPRARGPGQGLQQPEGAG